MPEPELDPTPARRSKRRRALVLLLLSASLATLGAGAVSLAVFTDSQAATGSWSAGSVVLDVNPSVAFTASDIMPGDVGSQTLAVSNTGTGDLRYAMTSSATNADGKNLAGQLDLTIETGACGSTTGTLFSGKLDAAAFGDPTSGADAGDRSLAAGGSEDLCFSWSFPLASGNAYQSAATTATFTFDAEQTANNP